MIRIPIFNKIKLRPSCFAALRPSCFAALRRSCFVASVIAVVTLCLFVSCDKEHIATLFVPGSGPEGSCGFASSVMTVEISPEDEGVISIPIYRNGDELMTQKVQFQYDTSGTGSVADSLWCDVDPNDIFKLATSNVIFRQNSRMAYVMVGFSDLTQLLPGNSYIMRLKLVGQEKSLQKHQITLNVKRKLVFEKYGDCTYQDSCIFDKPYPCELYKAVDAEVYRVMDPYSKPLAEEGYTEAGLTMAPPDYVEFMVDEDNRITFSPYYTGMLVPLRDNTGRAVGAYGYYPGDYKWGADFSEYNQYCKRVSDTQFEFYAVYCLPDFQFGYLDRGVFKVTIKMI